MQTQALADPGFRIPSRPLWARPVRARPAPAPSLARLRQGGRAWLAGLGPVQQVSLGGILGLLTSWGLAELALRLGGF